MAEYPTRQFSASDAYSSYMQSLEDAEKKKKAYNIVHHMYKLTNPHYSGSTEESANLSKISKLGAGTSSGLATRLRLMTEADKENLGVEFTGSFQQALEGDLFTTLGKFNSWANKQGPWYDEDLRRKHATTVKDLLAARKSSKVAESVDDLYDKYWPIWGSGIFEDQMRVRNEIADDEAITRLPKKYQSEAINQIHARLRDTLVATGRYAAEAEGRKVAAEGRKVVSEDRSVLAEARSVSAEEERLWKFERLKSDKANVDASLAIAREMAMKVEELVNSGMSIQDAKNVLSEEAEYTGYNTEEFDKRVKSRVGTDAKPATPTQALKTTEEMRSLLSPTKDKTADLSNAQKALEAEIRRGPILNAAWYDFGVSKQRAIAVENFLRTLQTVDRERFLSLNQLKTEFEKHMANWGDEGVGEESIRVMEEAVIELRLPRLVIEYILFPEKFEFGRKG